MPRVPLRIALDVLLTIVFALVLLGLRETIQRGDAAAGFAEGARLLFLFMDIGLGVWLVALIVIAVRGRATSRWAGVGVTLLALLGGVIVNLLVVIVVGFAQRGSLPTQFVGYAIEAGICALLAALPAVTLIHRLVKPRVEIDRRA
ncbi:hypothetical protein BH11ACT3_BH11ACT3_12740 [soil metagenome]